MMTRSNRPTPRAFTLTELLVVLGIVVLAMGIVLPSIIPLLTSGAASQVRIVLGSLFGAARSLAVEQQSYALVHFQMGPDEKCWAAVLIYDKREKNDDGTDNPTFGQFVRAEGYKPRKMPGGIALIGVSQFSSPDNRNFRQIFSDFQDATKPNPMFFSFNVVFGADGSLAQLAPEIHVGSQFFAGTPDQKIWDPSVPTLNQPSVRMMVAFRYKEFRNLSDASYSVPDSRAYYLQNNGQYFVINPYTGQLLPSE
jgi:prepilin-type N-terminal cleavage/methylation domain-containing protein